MICYRFEDGMLWKQHRVPCRSSPSRTRVVAQRPVPFTLDTTRSHDVVFTSMLRDYFAGDALAELQASVMGSRIVNLFPNKRRAGNWTISEDDLAVAVVESLVRHKLAVLCAPIEIEYLGGQRRDTLRERPMSNYRRDDQEFRNSIANRADELKAAQEQRKYVERYEYAVQHPDEYPHPEFHARYGRNVGEPPSAFAIATQRRVDEFKKPHSTARWWKLVVVEFFHQCGEKVWELIARRVW
jgi:hypothetical protein